MHYYLSILIPSTLIHLQYTMHYYQSILIQSTLIHFQYIQSIIIYPYSFHPPSSTCSIRWYNPLLSVHSNFIHTYSSIIIIHPPSSYCSYNPFFILPSHIHSIHPHPPAVNNPLLSIILFHSYILNLIHLQYKIHYYSTIIIPTNLIHIQYTIHYKSSFSSIYTHSPSLYCSIQSIVIHPSF